MIKLVNSDAVTIPLGDGVVNLVVTSPPYWGLRSYEGNQNRIWGGDENCSHAWGDERYISHSAKRDHNGKDFGDTRGVEGNRQATAFVSSTGQYCQRCHAWRGAFGLEPTPDQFIANLVTVFAEVKRVLHKSGLCFVNLGDSYASGGRGSGRSHRQKMGKKTASAQGLGRKVAPDGLKDKDLCLIPQRAAIALQADGWWVRSFMPWPKGNALPESVRDRPTTSHEYWIMLAKSKRYFWDGDAVRVKSIDPAGKSRGGSLAHEGNDLFVSANAHRGEAYQSSGSRNRRTSDTWNDGLDELIAHHRRYLAHLEAIRDGVGMMLDENGEPAALKFNTSGYAGSHFATFPPRMITPLIKAGASEFGVCSVCREPFVRVAEREKEILGGSKGTPRDTTNPQVIAGLPRARVHVTTTGHHPNCECNAPSIPALVMDPFVGSGTTLQVVRALSRDAIGFDLSFPYLAEQARSRLSLDALDAWQNGIQSTDASDLEELPLFARMEER